MKDKTVVLATYDLFNSVGRQLASQLLKGPAEWVLVPRAQILRAMKTVYGVGAETFDEILKANRSFESTQDIEGATDLNADDPDASVVKFVNQIIRRRSWSAPPIFTSSRLRTTCVFATGSTEFCTKWPCRRNCVCCSRPSSHA